MIGSFGNGMGWLGWLGVGAFGLFWFFLLGLLEWLVMRLLPGSRSDKDRPTAESATGILDRRLARGEIDMPAWQAQRVALQGTQDNRK